MAPLLPVLDDEEWTWPVELDLLDHVNVKVQLDANRHHHCLRPSQTLAD